MNIFQNDFIYYISPPPPLSPPQPPTPTPHTHSHLLPPKALRSLQIHDFHKQFVWDAREELLDEWFSLPAEVAIEDEVLLQCHHVLLTVAVRVH